jgi:hypothetical protein
LLLDVLGAEYVLQVYPTLLALDDLVDDLLSQDDVVEDLLCSLAEGSDVTVRDDVAGGGQGLIKLYRQCFDLVDDDDLARLLELLEFEL